MKAANLSVWMMMGLLLAPLARAEYSFSCGEGREKGLKDAELALVYDAKSDESTLYRHGKEVAPREYIVKSGDDYRWFVTLLDKKDDVVGRIEFSEKERSAQEFKVDKAGNEKKLGKLRKCDVKNGAPPAAAALSDEEDES